MNVPVAGTPRRRLSPAGAVMLLAAVATGLFPLFAPARAANLSISTPAAEELPRNRATRTHPRKLTYLKNEWGVEVLYVRQTAAGYMLEFRYKVLDADKAKPLFLRQVKPVLTHVESGAQLIVPTPPKTGALRNSNTPIAGRTYWMFFANPGRLAEPGDLVNVQIGEFLAMGIAVQ